MKKKQTARAPRDVRPARSSSENAPFCRLCETRHWSREPHAFSKAAKAKRR